MDRTQTAVEDDLGTPTTLTVEAGGFAFTLVVRALPAPSYRDRWFVGSATLTPTIGGDVPAVQTTVDGLLPDLERLCDWIEDHVQALLNGQMHQSKEWVPLHLAMNVQYLLGEIDNTDGGLSGDFSIRIMLRVGRDHNGTAVYAGLEGSVGVEEALAFCTATRTYIASYR